MDIRFLKRVKTVGFFIIIFTLFYYQIIKGNYYLQKAKDNYLKLIPNPSLRANIYDRENRLLAYDRACFCISVFPYQIKKKRKLVFSRLANIFGVSEKKIRRNYRRNFRGDFLPVPLLSQVSKEKAILAKELLGQDILIQTLPQRFYPYPYSFSHILGYVKKASPFLDKLKKYGYEPEERVGFLGLEQYYDGYLRGQDGGDLVEVDAQGRIVGYSGRKYASRGKDLYLSIDARMQILAYNYLKRFGRGTIIIMNSHSGEILVMCSYPSYNLNDFIKGKKIKKLITSPQAPLINRAIQARYGLGSVVKPLLGLMALEDKVITPQTIFVCRGSLSLGDSEFHCLSSHGPQNVVQALIHSCNIFFYNLGLRAGVDKMSEWLRRFHLDKPTGIDLPYEEKGVVPDRFWKRKRLKQGWFPGDTLNMSIGQGYLCATPLEVAVAMNVFANGGYLVRPRLLRRVEDKDYFVFKKEYIGVHKKNLDVIRRGLRGVVKDPTGTAHLLERLGLEIAGKTGTVQVPGKKAHGWFVGFFPYRSPQYTICVFLENAGSSHQAVQLAYYLLRDLKDTGFLKIKNKNKLE